MSSTRIEAFMPPVLMIDTPEREAAYRAMQLQRTHVPAEFSGSGYRIETTEEVLQRGPQSLRDQWNSAFTEGKDK